MQEGVLYSSELLGIVDSRKKGNQCHWQDYCANGVLGKFNFESRTKLLIIDIEGGEQELVNCCDLPGVRKIMIEFHPELIGEKGVLKLTDWLYSLGFVERAEVSSGVEKYFERGQ